MRKSMGGNVSVWVLLVFVLALNPSPVATAGENPEPPNRIIFDMDSLRHRPAETTNEKREKVPVGTTELVDGKFGKAVKFSFRGGGPGFMTASLPSNPDWNKADGFSFYVKGDGSTNWAGLELIDKEDYSLRYAYCFPLGSTDWKKITVRWSDLTPELASPLVDANHGYAPGKFGNFWFGKWFYWREYPPVSFAIDQVVLEERIEPVRTTGAPGNLGRIKAKLAQGQPVTFVTMGDSLSDKRHWANREVLWSEILARRLREEFKSEVTLVNPAVGGTTLSQNVILLPRWASQAPQPDLVTIWFGYNDWDSGVRRERFKDYLALAVDRIRNQTGPETQILILTTCPAFERWETMRELEQACREAAREKQVALVDIAERFRASGTPDKALEQAYWAWDKTHLGKNGHEVVAAEVQKVLAP